MNLQKVREVEIRNEAEDALMRIVNAHCLKGGKETHFKMRGTSDDPNYKHWLKLAGPIGGRYSPKSAPDLLAIINILKAHVRGARFEESDLEIVHSILNKRVTQLFYSRSKHDNGWYLVPEGPRIRFTAEAVLRYLQHSAEWGNREQIPIGLCPNCDGLFLKRKANQVHCRDLCRAEGWTAEKRKTDPKYFSRLAKYRRAHLKGHLPNRQKKTVVKTEGE